MWNQVQPVLVEGDFDKAREMTSKDDSAIAQLLSIGLARQGAVRRREDIEIAMDESMIEITPQLEKRTHYLATFANLATLLGLLGTVSGLIHAFARGGDGEPGGQGEPAVGEHLGGDELHGLRPDDRGADPARARVPADEDERADREPRDGVREVPERRHRATDARTAAARFAQAAQR